MAPDSRGTAGTATTSRSSGSRSQSKSGACTLLVVGQPMGVLLRRQPRFGLLVLHEGLVARRDVPLYQLVEPPLVLLDGGEDARSFGAVHAIAVDEEAESLECATAAEVGDGGVGSERGPESGGAGDVPEPGAGAGEVEVDERGCLPVSEDDVVEVGVVVADDFAGHRPWGRQRPFVRGVVEVCGGLVVGAEEFPHADKGVIGEGPVGVGRYRRGAGDVGEDLPALGVHSEKPWCAVEPGSFQMVEQGMGGRAGGALGAVDRVTDADDLAAVGDSTG